MIDTLTLSSSAIVPDDFGGATAADFYAHPVGAGPFAIRSTSSDAIDLKRNKHFYDKAHPYLSGIDYRVVSDPATALQQVSRGRTDLDESLPASDLSSGHAHARVVTTPSQSTSVLTFSSKAAPTDDPTLRKAVSLAIDRSALVKSVYDGKAVVAKGLLPGKVPADQGCPSCDWSKHDVSRHQRPGRRCLATDSSPCSSTPRTPPTYAPPRRSRRCWPRRASPCGPCRSTPPRWRAPGVRRLRDGAADPGRPVAVARRPVADRGDRPLPGRRSARRSRSDALAAVNAATDLSDTTSAVAAFEQQTFATAAAVPLVDPDVVDVVGKPVRGLALCRPGSTTPPRSG